MLWNCNLWKQHNCQKVVEPAQLPQVVEPVVVMTPMLVDMDTSGAGPGTTMGPGMLAQSEEMPLVLDADE